MLRVGRPMFQKSDKTMVICLRQFLSSEPAICNPPEQRESGWHDTVVHKCVGCAREIPVEIKGYTSLTHFHKHIHWTPHGVHEI